MRGTETVSGFGVLSHNALRVAGDSDNSKDYKAVRLVTNKFRVLALPLPILQSCWFG